MVEKETVLVLVRMIRHANNEQNSPAVREWARQNGKRALLTWSIIRQPLF